MHAPSPAALPSSLTTLLGAPAGLLAAWHAYGEQCRCGRSESSKPLPVTAPPFAPTMRPQSCYTTPVTAYLSLCSLSTLVKCSCIQASCHTTSSTRAAGCLCCSSSYCAMLLRAVAGFSQGPPPGLRSHLAASCLSPPEAGHCDMQAEGLSETLSLLSLPDKWRACAAGMLLLLDRQPEHAAAAAASASAKQALWCT